MPSACWPGRSRSRPSASAWPADGWGVRPDRAAPRQQPLADAAGGLRAAELLAALEERGVRLTGPEPFCVGSEPAPQAVRLCLGGARSREALAQALKAVKGTLQAPPPIPWRTL